MYQIRKIKADTLLCLFADELWNRQWCYLKYSMFSAAKIACTPKAEQNQVCVVRLILGLNLFHFGEYGPMEPNYCTGISLTLLVADFWIKHGKYWFSHTVYSNFTTMATTETKLWFFSSLEHFKSSKIRYSVLWCVIILSNLRSAIQVREELSSSNRQ